MSAALVAALMAGLLGVMGASAPAAQAAVSGLRTATFNMWNSPKYWGEVQELLGEANAPQAIALQEVEKSEPPGYQCAGGDNRDFISRGPKEQIPYTVIKCTAVGNYFYYFLETRVAKNRTRNIAFLVDRDIALNDTNVHVIGRVGAIGDSKKSPKPMLGIRVAGTWLYSAHAENGGGDASSLVEAAHDDAGTGDWAVMGDFNRESDQWPQGELDALGARLIATTEPTRDDKVLDYMIAGTGTSRGVHPKRIDDLKSDHWAVRFGTDCAPVARSSAGPKARAVGDACTGRPSAIVSMGDSYLSGEGGRWAGNALTKEEGDVWGTDRKSRCQSGQDCVYDATSYVGGNRCDRSDVAPIKGVEFDGIPAERRFNLACSGATTENITSTAFKDKKPQVQQLTDLAREYDIRMVVLSIGGNDLNFSEIVQACAKSYLEDSVGNLDPAVRWQCSSTREKAFADALDGVRAKVTKNLMDIRSAMRAAGQSDYRLVLQSYPNVLPKSSDYRYGEGALSFPRYTSGGCPFRDTDSDWARDSVVPRISSMLRAAAGTAGAKFLDVQNAFAGHELCAKSAEQATSANNNSNPLPAEKAEWVRWVPYLASWTKAWFEGKAQGDQQEAIHPNAFGQLALASCLTGLGQALAQNDVAAYECGAVDGGTKTSPLRGEREGVVRLRNALTGEVLDAAGARKDDYLITSPDKASGSQRWLLRNAGTGRISLQAQHNGRYLDTWNSWTYLGGKEKAWFLSRRDDGRVALSLDQGRAASTCLAQDPGKESKGKKWVSHDPCPHVMDDQYWYIDYPADVVITPRDPAGGTEPRDGGRMELRSATGTVMDLKGSSTESGTSVQAYEPNDSEAQRWVMRSLGGENWRITAAAKPGMAVDHDPGPHRTHLVETQEGNANQVWQAKAAGGGWYTLVSGADGRCLSAGEAEQPLELAACEADSPKQRWKFREAGTAMPVSTIRGLEGKCVEPRDGSRDDRTPIRLATCAGSDGQGWTAASDGTLQTLAKCLDVDGGRADNGTPVQLYACNGSAAQRWVYSARQELRNPSSGKCLDVPGSDTARALQLYNCNGSDAQKWQMSAPPIGQPDGGDAGDPYDGSLDDRGTKPAFTGDCRPEGMAQTQGVAARYCDAYDSSGREWVGNNRTRRLVGYFTGWRAGVNGDPKYLVSNIPWSKVTHINYAFAKVDGNRISIGDESDPQNPATGMTWPGEKNAMDSSLPYKGHFNLLNSYKKKHPAVKTLISVGGWADTRNFYAMTTNADGSVNQAGIDTFADSVTEFLDRYGFNGVDIDYEYPTALPNTGNPKDWDVSNPRRKGLQQGYNALMKTLREKLDWAGADKGRYYLLTSAGSSSGYLVRGLDAGQALQYQDYVNVMTYDLHGSWNKYVGPQAPLYDDGKDHELADAGIYNDQAADTKDFQKHGYFNTDWAYHYYRGALPPGRINLGIPYYSRGWRDVQGGSDGLWGTATMPEQSQCPLGTGGRGPANAQACGLGAVGIDNVWHDTENGREVGAGSNPLWHTKNLQAGITPGYLTSYGVDTDRAEGQLSGTYAEKYSDALQAPWLWNASKRVFLSTENEKSIDAKSRYITDKGIGGAMIWELAGDYTQRPGGEWGMGYDLTTRLDNALKGAGAYGNTKAGGQQQPREVIDVTAQLVDFPTGKDDFYPIQPKLRITNNTGVTLAQGTQISLDLPTSTPPVVKDNDYKEIKGLTPGHTGPNVGGLKGDFHRLTLTLGYCEDLAPGKSRDIDLKYYLPITGPSNVTFTIGGKEYASTGDRRRDVSAATPPAPSTGSECQAATWKQGQVYRPDGGRLWRMYDKGDKGWMFEYGDSPPGNPMMIDNNPDQSRVHLVEAMEQNPNQYWKIQLAGEGTYTVSSGERCMTATAARKDIASLGCDGRAEQKWKLVPIADNGSEGAPGAPKHNGVFKLRSLSGGNDLEVAGGTTDQGTHILAGDTKASTAAFVKHQGYYWYAQWYTTAEPGTAEANGGKPWKRLSPAP
ncbi:MULTISPECIES: glycosyl hydrolase family 18 protein [unclassified Streptomyces]|uniref:Glycosyl hydrolase family 18 protein n=1 Tax=Streptomyces sp. NBC_00060 TaxID=2975636 RepID=A0AAU2HDY7_9ACTN